VPGNGHERSRGKQGNPVNPQFELRTGDVSVSGARAKPQPAIVANTAKTAPARTLPTATIRQRSSAPTVAAPSAAAAAMTRAMGK